MRNIGILSIILSLAIFNIHTAAADGESAAKGIEYCKSGMYDEAIIEFNKAIEKDPSDAEAYNNRGIAYLARLSSEKTKTKDLKKMVSDFNSANSDFSRAIRLKPDFAAAYYNRGLTNIAQYEKAIADFTMAIELNPGNARAYYYRAVEYFNMKEYVKSLGDVRKAQSLNYEVDPNFLKKLAAKSSN